MAITDFVFHLAHWEHIQIPQQLHFVSTVLPFVRLAIKLDFALPVFQGHFLALTIIYVIILVLDLIMVITRLLCALLATLPV